MLQQELLAVEQLGTSIKYEPTVTAVVNGKEVTAPAIGDWLFPELPVATFAIIYADPPWDYKGQLQHAGAGSQDTGGAERHYPTVTLADLKELDVRSIAADDSLLFMWSSSPHLDQAIDLGKSWGFAWATVGFVWDKQRVNPGFYTMSQCELCLVFKRGKIPTPRGARNVRQMVSVKRGRHSQKPAEVRQRIDEMFPLQSKIELFARANGTGGEAEDVDTSEGELFSDHVVTSWETWGLEANGA